MRGPRLIALLAGLILSGLGIWKLEAARSGLVIAPLEVGSTPATAYWRADVTKAPAVIVAHGFAGSRQLMEAYALTLARAGYVAVSLDFEGHGRNPTPMRGDVTRIEGTTQYLKREIGRVTDAALALPVVDGRVALLGHSMASDILVRRALEDPRVGATVAISIFSDAPTATGPRDLLMIDGAWERRLRENALRNLRLADRSANEGETLGDPARGDGRRAAVAPAVEHVGVLYSAAALTEARAWLDAAFGRTSDGPVAAIGVWVALTIAGLVMLAWPLSQLLPPGEAPRPPLPRRTFLVAALVPAVAAPLVVGLAGLRVLPVVGVDALALTLGLYGLLSLGLLRLSGVRVGRIAWLSAFALAAYGVVVLGGALDRYFVSFAPSFARLPILALLTVGAIPYMLADSLLTEAGRASWPRVFVARGAFLASIAALVALDFRRLFFLIVAIPIVLVFYVVFGLMGGWVGRRTRSPGAVGLGLGLILAWTIAVTFPLYAPG